MTRKDKILEMVTRLAPDDVSYDQIIYHLEVMREVDAGLEDVHLGRVMDHEEFMKELESEDGEDKTAVVGPRTVSSEGNSEVHSEGKSEGGNPLRKKNRTRRHSA